MSAGLLGPDFGLLVGVLEDDCFLGLLLELFGRDEDCLFFFLGLTVRNTRRLSVKRERQDLGRFLQALKWAAGEKIILEKI